MHSSMLSRWAPSQGGQKGEACAPACGSVDGTVGEHGVGGGQALHQLGQDLEVTLALSSLDHVESLGAELLPLLALGLAGRLVSEGNNNGFDRLSKVLSLESGDLGSGAGGVESGHGSVFGVPSLPAVPILYIIGSCWQPCSVNPHAGRSASACVQWVELTPDQVAKRIVHVVMAGILIGVALSV